MDADVVIVGGGPAGLAAALALGRARKRVLLCDDEGARRNLAAVHLQNFVTRDGTPPEQFRRIAREQLAAYPSVTVHAGRVEAIDGEHGRFYAHLSDGQVSAARRVLLCTGMIDDVPSVPGARALWGTAIFQCPYCHGWEVQDARFAYWASSLQTIDFAIFLRGWSRDVVLLTNRAFDIPDTEREKLRAARVGVEERAIERFDADGPRLRAVVLTSGDRLMRDAIFMHPPQRQVPLVRSLQLTVDSRGFVQVDESQRTSVPGIYAAGDLTTPRQAATLAAAAGMHAAAMLNHELTMELAVAGALV